MEPQLSVLLYSKYSSLSKNLMDMMNRSGVDFNNKFSLQTLCIDNEEIRNRIIKNKKIEVTTVPCLLLIFLDGGIEKYDGVNIFEWVKGIIRQFAPPPPPPPPPPPQQSEEEKWFMKKLIEQHTREKKILEQQKERELSKIREENKNSYQEQTREPQRQQRDRMDSIETEKSPPIQHIRRQVHKSPPKLEQESQPESQQESEPERERSVGLTSIEDLEDLSVDEEDIGESDRYRSRKPIGRIRSDEGNYEEGKDLFQGPTTTMRKAKKSALKSSHTGKDAKTQKSLDIMSRAKELAKNREDSNPIPPPGHPLNQRM